MASSQTTTRNSLRTLAKSILNRLENRKFVLFEPKNRTVLHDELFARLSKKVLTEEDLNEMVRGQVTQASDAITDSKLTETEAFQSQKRAVRARIGEHELQGFYLQDTLRAVSQDVCQFLFDSSHIDDVFESDEVIQKLVMETIQTFDESKLS